MSKEHFTVDGDAGRRLGVGEELQAEGQEEGTDVLAKFRTRARLRDDASGDAGGRDEEEPVQRRADGQDPARGGRGLGSRGGEEARDQRADAVRVEETVRADGGARRATAAPARE